MRILAISGSLRRDSHNTALLRAAAELLPSEVELAIYERLGELPPFNEELVGDRPAPAQHLWDEIAAVDGVLISTPEYNSSIPGVLKNALDWMSQPLVQSPLRNKPVAVIGASTGMFGAVWSQAETRKVLGAIGARVVDRELPVPTAHEQFNEDGRLSDEDLEAELVVSLTALVDAIEARAAQRRAANDGDPALA
jgi:chromate reductase, NAD(P)H dehydrogenase (quinone)